MATFYELARPGKCDVCNKETDVVVCSSVMGAISFAYCEECYAVGAEPYSAMVSCVASCGDWPNSINEEYRKIICNGLKYLGVSEDQFANDVDEANRAMEEFFASYESCVSDTHEF